MPWTAWRILCTLRVAIAEDEMDGEALEEPDRFRVLNVAAVQDDIDVAILKESQRLLDGGVTAVRVAEDGDLHERFPLLIYRFATLTSASTKK